MRPCLFCDGDRDAPEHAARCDGQHGRAASTYPDGAGWKLGDTSRAAAESVPAAALRRAVQDCLQARGAMTADECAAVLDLSVLAVRPRFSELRALGLIADSGQRHRNTSGKRAVVWQLLRAAS